jgi:hypothetical protein
VRLRLLLRSWLIDVADSSKPKIRNTQDEVALMSAIVGGLLDEVYSMLRLSAIGPMAALHERATDRGGRWLTM